MKQILTFLSAIVIGAGLNAPLPEQTQAKPRVSTKTQHYRVSGSDAGAIVRSMMGQHRLLGGRGRVGRTKMTRKVEWDFRTFKGQCRVKRHKVRLSFLTQLPRHRAEKRLRKRLRKQWRGFARRIRWHEAQHRRIWLSCARQADRAVRRARAASCSALVRKLDKIYERSNAACDRQHAAFDRKETRKLARHPLIRAGTRRK